MLSFWCVSLLIFLGFLIFNSFKNPLLVKSQIKIIFSIYRKKQKWKIKKIKVNIGQKIKTKG